MRVIALNPKQNLVDKGGLSKRPGKVRLGLTNDAARTRSNIDQVPTVIDRVVEKKFFAIN